LSLGLEELESRMNTRNELICGDGFSSSSNQIFERPHVVHFYEEDSSLVQELSLLVGTALVSGDAVIVVASETHRNALAQGLRARGLEVATALAEGRYVPLDSSQTLSRFMVSGMPDPQRFADLIGETITRTKAAAKSDRPRVLIFGEMVALLWADGRHEAAIRLEELWNDLATKHSFSLRCAYPMNGFRKREHMEPFMKICAEHSGVIPDENYTALLSDDQRLRHIAALQQRVQALENERALRESEQRFRLLVEAVQDYAIFMLDTEGRVSSWNMGAQRIKGYKASEIIGTHFSRFYPEEDLRAGKPQRELEIATREGRLEDEGWRLRKDGSRFWANVVITALKDNAGNPIGFTKVTRDFTERMQAQRALQQSQQRLQDSEKSLRRLSHHLLRTQDEERRRIGRDLHDSLGQYLTVLKMKVDSLASAAALNHTGDVDELKECAQFIAEAITEVRTISYLLYPPMLEEMGLSSAIPWYLEGFTKRSGIQTRFEISPEFRRLPADVELALFRVLQESLTNIHRHSGSPTANIRLSVNGSVILEVSDQGKGLQLGNFEDSDQDWTVALGVGVRGMSERMRQLGGKLELSSTAEGTKVTATVPVQERSSDTEPCQMALSTEPFDSANHDCRTVSSLRGLAP
jgi:PAS domain S-box-containing protein